MQDNENKRIIEGRVNKNMMKIKEGMYKWADTDCSVRLNYVAQQAEGSVWIQLGGTVVVVAFSKESTLKDFPGYFPLSVDYREQFAATGKIPGGYLKREGKPSEREVLLGRIVDRCMRPLFAEDYFDKIQIVITVYSLEKENLPSAISVIGTSLAACLAGVPFLGPVGGCEIAKVGGIWVVNPTHDQLVEAESKLFVAGTMDGINMVEGSSKGVSESELIDAFFLGHNEIKKQIEWQLSIIRAHSGSDYCPAVVEDTFNVGYWKSLAAEFLDNGKIVGLFLEDKREREVYRNDIWNAFYTFYEKKIEEKLSALSLIQYAFDSVLKDKIMGMVCARGSRIDGRKYNDVRSISAEVGILPRNHGSAIFNRGRTQVLVSTTLGGSQDEMRFDGLIDQPDTHFMLHYNFLPFSAGEAKGLRAPGRREIGHGNLAANALKSILPDKNEFPYTIRIVSDVLECDGSTSQATVCGGMMSLMDAGVPVADIVGGIAMGMMYDKNAGSFIFFTDLSGIEDEFGLMDFKVAGTKNLITAIQMDIKYKGGLDRTVFQSALEEAKKARLFIIDKMVSVLPGPRKELPPFVPRFSIFHIAKEKIGAVIGSGGKVIRDITERTGVSISIEDDGEVKIFGEPGEKMDQAILLVKVLGGQGDALVGRSFTGTVKRVVDFGWFIEILPNIDGLVHVSSLSRNEVGDYRKVFQEGDTAPVLVVDYDSATCRIRLKIVK